MEKIKAIIKRPDEEYGHMTWISNTLENLQRTVGGFIEVVPITNEAVMIVNEEGKIKNLERNFRFGTTFPDTIRGEVIICGVDGEEFADIPFDFKAWKNLLKFWGN